MTAKRPAADDPFLSPKVTTSRYLPKSPPPGQENPHTPQDSDVPEETPKATSPEAMEAEDTGSASKPLAKAKATASPKSTAKAKAKKKSTPKGLSPNTKAKAKAKSAAKGLSPKSKAKTKAKTKAKAKATASPKSTAKAKAKATASPKSTAKAKAKTKAKAKATPKKKDKPEEEGEDKTKKRPAAAKSTLREQTEKWKKGALTKEEEEEPQEEAEEGVDETGEKKDTRDSGKARAFSRLAKKGAVPSMIRDMLAEIDKSDQPRAKKTALINALFKKTADGGFEMKTNSEEFEAFKESFKKNTETDKVEGEPKAVFLYRVYHGNAEALEAAISQGHVKETMRKGMVYCYYPSWTIAQEKGTTDRGELRAKSKLNTEEFNSMADAFSRISRKKESPQALPSSGSRTQLALEDAKAEAKNTKVDWNKLQPLLEEAKAANDRLEKDFFKLKTRVQKADDNKLLQNLKDLVVQCTDTQKQLGHALVWNEAPPDSNVEWTAEGVNKWLYQMATKTEALDEGLEQIKAVLKARNL